MNELQSPERLVAAYPNWVKICGLLARGLNIGSVILLIMTPRWTYIAMMLISLGVIGICQYYRAEYRYWCRKAAYDAGRDPTEIDFV